MVISTFLDQHGCLQILLLVLLIWLLLVQWLKHIFWTLKYKWQLIPVICTLERLGQRDWPWVEGQPKLHDGFQASPEYWMRLWLKTLKQTSSNSEKHTLGGYNQQCLTVTQQQTCTRTTTRQNGGSARLSVWHDGLLLFLTLSCVSSSSKTLILPFLTYLPSLPCPVILKNRSKEKLQT